MKKEASAITGFITTLVAALIILGTEFGLPLTDGQQTAINVVVAIIAPAIAGLIIRSKVWSEESHRADKAKAVEETARAYGYREVPDADA